MLILTEFIKIIIEVHLGGILKKKIKLYTNL